MLTASTCDVTATIGCCYIQSVIISAQLSIAACNINNNKNNNICHHLRHWTPSSLDMNLCSGS